MKPWAARNSRNEAEILAGRMLAKLADNHTLLRTGLEVAPLGRSGTYKNPNYLNSCGLYEANDAFGPLRVIHLAYAMEYRCSPEVLPASLRLSGAAEWVSMPATCARFRPASGRRISS